MRRTATRAGSGTAGAPAGLIASGVRAQPPDAAEPNEVLVEQLRYLIAYAGQEQDRLERVQAILMETFR